jgi:hypothetical protein
MPARGLSPRCVYLSTLGLCPAATGDQAGGRRTGRQTDRRTGGQTDRRTDGRTDKKARGFVVFLFPSTAKCLVSLPADGIACLPTRLRRAQRVLFSEIFIPCLSAHFITKTSFWFLFSRSHHLLFYPIIIIKRTSGLLAFFGGGKEGCWACLCLVGSFCNAKKICFCVPLYYWYIDDDA